MSNSHRILLVDDEDGFRRELAEQLRLHEGFEVHEAASAREAWQQVERHSYDAIVLDLGLPDEDGRDLCRLLRTRGIKAPIIVLTAHAGDAETMVGPDGGANDSIAKPVRLSILLARLRVQLRQFEFSDDRVFPIGPYRFHPASKMLVMQNGQRIRLTEKETAILKYLYRVGDRPVPREVLLDELWGYNAGVTTHTLETHIYRLRQKIEPAAGETSLLITEPGGYRLVR